MKQLTTLIILLSLFVGQSCEVPSTLEKPFPPSIANARTSNFVNTDLTGQWKIVYVSLGDYGYHSGGNNSCLVSDWLYFSSPDYSSDDVIEGNWTTTNLSCTGSHSGQDLLDAWGDHYSIAFEEWNSISGMSQRYSFNKATGSIALSRGVSSSANVNKYLNFGIAPDKQMATTYGTSSGYYTDIVFERASGGPSIP